MERFEIAADGDRFRDHGAVVEYQRRYPLHWIDGGIGFGPLLQRTKIHLFGRDFEALLGEKNAHAPWIGSAAAVVKLHRYCLGIAFAVTRRDLSVAPVISPGRHIAPAAAARRRLAPSRKRSVACLPCHRGR